MGSRVRRLITIASFSLILLTSLQPSLAGQQLYDSLAREAADSAQQQRPNAAPVRRRLGWDNTAGLLFSSAAQLAESAAKKQTSNPCGGASNRAAASPRVTGSKKRGGWRGFVGKLSPFRLIAGGVKLATQIAIAVLPVGETLLRATVKIQTSSDGRTVTFLYDSNISPSASPSPSPSPPPSPCPSPPPPPSRLPVPPAVDPSPPVVPPNNSTAENNSAPGNSTGGSSNGANGGNSTDAGGSVGGASGNGASGNGTSGNGTSGNGASGNGTSGNGTSGNGTSSNGAGNNGTSSNGAGNNGTSSNGDIGGSSNNSTNSTNGTDSTSSSTGNSTVAATSTPGRILASLLHHTLRHLPFFHSSPSSSSMTSSPSADKAASQSASQSVTAAGKDASQGARSAQRVLAQAGMARFPTFTPWCKSGPYVAAVLIPLGKSCPTPPTSKYVSLVKSKNKRYLRLSKGKAGRGCQRQYKFQFPNFMGKVVQGAVVMRVCKAGPPFVKTCGSVTMTSAIPSCSS